MTESIPSPQSRPEKRWPIKLHLVPVSKAFLKDTPLLLVADCAPMACPGMVGRHAPGKAALIVCPKLEDKQEIMEKLAEIIQANRTPSLHLVRMSIPCCCLSELVAKAQELAGTELPVSCSTISIHGHEEISGFGTGSKTAVGRVHFGGNH